MSIYLPAPARAPRGPDGKGWSRLAFLADMCGDECALRPRSHHKLWESRDTRMATYGGYGPCSRKGDCKGCPVLTKRTTLRAFTSRVMVRIHPEDGQPHLMNKPEDGWDSYSLRWTWERLAALQGWRLESSRLHRDEWSEHFWLVAAGSAGGDRP